MATLAKKIATALAASNAVVIVREADETLAVDSARMALKPSGLSYQVLSAGDPETSQTVEEYTKPGSRGALIVLDFLAVNSDNPLITRTIRDFALQRRQRGEARTRLILVEHPMTTIPKIVQSDVAVIESALPSVADLRVELNTFLKTPRAATKELLDIDALSRAVSGLARHEASKLYSRCLVENKRLDATWLRSEKARRVSARLDGAISFEKPAASDVGGLENLRKWLAQRADAFCNQKARDYGLPEPKGLLLLGVPGCGKSLTAKTIADLWGLPLLKLDAGKLFGSLVGQSEKQARQAIEAAEACSPCVLWIDEIEKGLAGGSASATDSGTSQRVFGTLLTWLQDKTSPVFVVATANRVSGLPPELLRKGRFDEIFFVGLPSREEREEIASIHLRRRFRPEEFASTIAEATDGFSGAEIEQCIIDAMFAAFADGARELKRSDLQNSALETTPLSRTMRDEIIALERWAATRARPASIEKQQPAAEEFSRPSFGV